MEPVDEGFVVIDLLGRRRTGVVDWSTAEDTLDELGLSYLAEPYELQQDDGTWLRIRIAEVSPLSVRVKKEDWGDMRSPQIHFSLPFPVPDDRLRRVNR